MVRCWAGAGVWVFVVCWCHVLIPRCTVDAAKCSQVNQVKWGVQRIWEGRNRVYSAVKPVDTVGYFIHTPVQLAVTTHAPNRTVLFQSTFHHGEISSIEPDRLGNDEKLAFAVIHRDSNGDGFVSFCKINLSTGEITKIYSNSIDLENVVVGLSVSFRRTEQTQNILKKLYETKNNR